MSQKILLIEVDEKERQTSAQVLRDNHFTVSTAKDGPTGLKVFKHNVPDLVISNLVLGDMTAVDVCERIRSTPGGEKIGIVLVSNGARSAKYIEGIKDKYKVLKFMQKPFSPDDLLKVAKEALGSNGSGKVAHDSSDDSLSVAVNEQISEAFTPEVKPSRFFPGLILYYTKTKATGVLRVRKGTDEKTVYLEKGNLVGIDSKIKNEQLGPVLVEKGVISEQDYMKAARLMVEESTQLGEAIVKLGFLEQEILDELLVEHQVIKIANCFLWLDAELKFQSASKLPEIKNYHVVPLADVFALGLQNLKKVSNLNEILKPIEKDYAVTNEVYTAYHELLGLSAEDLKPLEQLQSGYQIGEVSSAKTDFTLATLYLSGMLVTTTPTVAMLLKRVEALKEISGAAKLTKELEAKALEKEKQLAALQAEKAKIEKNLLQKSQEAEKQKSELAKAQAELNQTKQEALKSKPDPKITAQIAQLQKELSETKQKTEQFEKELSRAQEERESLEKECADLQHKLSGQQTQDAKTMDFASTDASSDSMMSELEPLAPSTPAAGFEAKDEVEDFFSSSEEPAAIEHGSPADSIFTTPAQPAAAAAAATVPDADLFSLGSELEELAPADTPNPDATIVFDPHAAQPAKAPPALNFGASLSSPPPAPASPFAPASKAAGSDDMGIFDLAGDLSGLEGTPQANPDTTVIYQPPPPKSPPKSDTLFQATEIDGEFDQVFDQNLETPETANTQPGAPNGALPLDPFAPENVRKQEVDEKDLDDFFSLPKE